MKHYFLENRNLRTFLKRITLKFSRKIYDKNCYKTCIILLLRTFIRTWFKKFCKYEPCLTILDLPWTNTLAYFAAPSVTKKKSLWDRQKLQRLVKFWNFSGFVKLLFSSKCQQSGRTLASSSRGRGFEYCQCHWHQE